MSYSGCAWKGKTSHLYALTFEVFECVDVRELRDASEAELEFTLEGTGGALARDDRVDSEESVLPCPSTR